MKNSPLLLPAAGFLIAVGCALAPRPELPPPYFGINPDTKICTQGTIEGSCGNGSTTRCTVYFDVYTGVEAYDTKSGTICGTPLFRASSLPEDPDTLFISE